MFSGFEAIRERKGGFVRKECAEGRGMHTVVCRSWLCPQVLDMALGKSLRFFFFFNFFFPQKLPFELPQANSHLSGGQQDFLLQIPVNKPGFSPGSLVSLSLSQHSPGRSPLPTVLPAPAACTWCWRAPGAECELWEGGRVFSSPRDACFSWKRSFASKAGG